MHEILQILFFLPFLSGLSRIDPLVDTKQGLIRGLRSDNGQYSMFLGIPYAVVDDTNPFGPSSPHTAFEGTYEAYNDSAICPQVENNIVLGTLDCLRLNVYVPKIATSQNRLPVMVWLHGGAFIVGSGEKSEYSPDYLIRHNVIIVTINYRLGPYGFLCLNIPSVSGNQGLKDQFIAMRWVKENIESFGGDASKVTIFGESAGAKSIHLHLLSNQEKLYDKAIIQSAAPVTPWSLATPKDSILFSIAEKLGFETNNVEEALTFLASQNVHLVTVAAHKLGLSRYVGTVLPETRPCLENEFEGAMITDYTFNLKSTKVRNMPIIFGYNSLEMIYKFGTAGPEVFETYSFKDRLESGLDLIDDEMAEIVEHFYIGDETVDETLKEKILNFESDFNYNHPTERTIKSYINDGASAVYYYVFGYEGDRNYLKTVTTVNITGASHRDELGYLFVSNLFNSEPNPEDQQVIDWMTLMWTNFAKTGDPTPEITESLPVKWLPVTKTTQNYLEIDSKLSTLTRPFQERMAFWDLFYKLNGESQTGLKNRKKTEL